MFPYAIKCLSEEEEKLFKRIEKAVNALPLEIDLGVDEQGMEIQMSCHILARAAAKVFSLKYEDGYYFPNYCHSWLRTKNGHLIDVYPVAMIGGPVLVVNWINSPIFWLYIKSTAREVSGGRFGQHSFKRSVKKIAKELEKNLKMSEA